MDLASGRRLRTRVAGIFLFLPLLARLRFDQIVQRAGYPGSQMVPATGALLSLLVLKLLDKERRSHISDFNFDEALGLFAGLNILPKATFATDYSYRTQRCHQQQLLSGWISALAPLLFPQGKIFSLDFHAIPFRGDPAALDNHFLPRRGKAGPSVLSFFAQESESRVLCYANANLTRADQSGELMRFVEFWQGLTGHDPEMIRLPGYEGEIRQLAVDGLGREQPTLFVSNNLAETARCLIIRYAGRNAVEDGLGTSVNFFHLDCLSSEVRLNVDLDAVLTVLANGCYRWLARRLHGFDKTAPKKVYRKFVETGGQVEVQSDRILVRFDKRSHNPILREAELDKGCPPIPWLGGRPVSFVYP